MLLAYALLLSVYFLLVGPLAGWPLLAASLRLLGVYDAATDGVLMALGSGVEPEESAGSGLALLRTATSASRLLASIFFGALWTLWEITAAFTCFGVALLTAGALSGLLLVRTPEPVEVVQTLPRQPLRRHEQPHSP